MAPPPGRNVFRLIPLAARMFPGCPPDEAAPLTVDALGLIDIYRRSATRTSLSPSGCWSASGPLDMVGQYEILWRQLSAGVIISTLPVAVLFTFLQRHLIRGLAAGR